MKTCTYKPLPRPSYRPCTNGVRHSLDSAPATWECSWSNDHGANLTEDLCEGCASELRRREIDAWLSQIDARVIHFPTFEAYADAVEDDGASFECGDRAARLALFALGEG